MSLGEFIQTGILGAFMTACVTVATCFISGVIGYKKMKVENFDKIYNSLTDFAEKREEAVDKCNKLVQELADQLPDTPQEMEREEWEGKCHLIYCGIKEMLTEYSKCLELLLSFSYCLYKNKPISPIVTAECWSMLDLYENFIAIDDMNRYGIKYTQIVVLVQFIKLKGTWKDKIRLKGYLKRNGLA